MRHFLIVSLFVIVLAGCSAKPSNNEIRDQVIAYLIDDSNKDIIEIVSFEKTNGFEKDPNTYVAEIRYKIVFRTSFEAVTKALMQSALNNFNNGSGNTLAGPGLLPLAAKYGQFRAGDSFEKVDQVTFIKTENGWRLAFKPQPAL